jgi:hypothetical protein
LFRDAIETTYLEDISRDDLLTFIEAQRKDECGQRTVANRVRYISSFLSHFKLTLPLKRNDIPKYTRKFVRAGLASDRAVEFGICRKANPNVIPHGIFLERSSCDRPSLMAVSVKI